MAGGDASQARLARRLEEVLSSEEVRTLMELVPPQRWDELRGQRALVRSEHEHVTIFPRPIGPLAHELLDLACFG